MIRFGVVLTVVLAAMGLLVGGVLASSLLLVYLAIGAAALAAVMLTVGVVVWREEVFGPSSAAQAGQAAKKAVGPAPVLATAGDSPAGRSATGRADDVAAVGVAAAQDDLVIERPPAFPPRPDWSDRLDQQEFPDWPKRPGLPERQGIPDSPMRSDRPDRQEQPDWAKHPDRPERPDPVEPAKLAEPAARLGAGLPDGPSRRPDSPGRRENAPTAESGSRPERTRRSPSGAWREAPAEPVPGRRRADEPAPGEHAPAGDIRPRAGREPAQSESEAGTPGWSFFSISKPVKPSVAGPGVTVDGGPEDGAGPGAVGAGGGDAASGGPRGPAAAREASSAAGEIGEAGEIREPGDPSKAAHAAEAAAPDAVRRPDAEPAAGRDRVAAEPAERDAPAEPADPEPASAPAEQASPKDAVAAEPGAQVEPEPPARSETGITTDSAARDGQAVQGPGTEVTVVPGITRYHRSQCILIRFLGPEDLQTMTLQAAEAASYMPCRACRPEQVLADD